MAIAISDSDRQEALARNVEQKIVQRTWGRIHRLQVEVTEGRLVVHGCTSSYYAKQLALEAALQLLGSTDATIVELDIQVGTAGPWAGTRRLLATA